MTFKHLLFFSWALGFFSKIWDRCSNRPALPVNIDLLEELPIRYSPPRPLPPSLPLSSPKTPLLAWLQVKATSFPNAGWEMVKHKVSSLSCCTPSYSHQDTACGIQLWRVGGTSVPWDKQRPRGQQASQLSFHALVNNHSDSGAGVETKVPLASQR